MASELCVSGILNLSNLVRNLLDDERSMENETGVVVIVGGKRQVTPIILAGWTRPQQLLAELTASSIALLLKVSFCFNNAIIHADLGLFRYFGI